jgi:hypothetical protein
MLQAAERSTQFPLSQLALSSIREATLPLSVTSRQVMAIYIVHLFLLAPALVSAFTHAQPQ